MKNNKIKYLVYPVIILFLACPNTSTPLTVDDITTPEGGGIEQVSDIFEYDSEKNEYQINSNNTDYIGEYGYTLWTELESDQNPFVSLDMTLTKFSGEAVAGFGLVFCSLENTKLILLINTQKEFMVGELTGNNFTDILSWEESSNLNQGYNQSNRVLITYNVTTKLFTINFNGKDETTFMDDEDPVHSSGKDGLIVVFSPNENFPNKPVNILFKRN